MRGILRSHRLRNVSACATFAAMEEDARLELLCAAPRLMHGDTALDLPASVPGWLLAVLAQRADGWAREALLALFWPDAAPDEAQHRLRVTLHRARHWLQSAGLAERLDADRRRLRLRVTSDVADFRAACGRADWAQAFALHRAPLLGGPSLAGFAALDEWARAEAAALADAWRHAALRHAEALAEGGDAAAAHAVLLSALDAGADDDAGEPLLQALLRVAGAAGARDAALERFERYRARLHAALDAEPLAETQSLANALRLGRAAPASRSGRTWPASLAAPPLVGRDVEQAALAVAREPVVVVVGEPGVGKSRLVDAALPQTLWLGCRAAWRDTPLQPLADWLDDQQASLDGVPAFEAQRRTLARLQPRLAPDEALSPLASADERERLLDALDALLHALQRPLVVDDLQWADDATLALLQRIVRRPGARVVATLRGAEAPPALRDWLAALELGGELRRLELTPLVPAAVEQLLARLAGRAAPRFAAWLHRRSGGNPLFALETLRALFDSGRLAQTSDGWASDLDALTHDYAELQLAPRLAALVGARVDALGDAAARTLAAAAVVGDARALPLLARLAELPERAVADAVAAAQAAGLLAGRAFAHELVREALLDTLAEAPRARLHAACARDGAPWLGAHALAQHAWAGGETALALEATLRAAARDAELGQHAQAAVALAAALPRLAEPAQRARVRVELARMELQRDALDAARMHAEAALDELPLPVVRADALVLLGELTWMQGSIAGAKRHLAAAAEIEADAPALLQLASRLAFHEGDYAQAIALLERRCAQLRRAPPGVELVNVLTSLGASVDSAGDVARGLPYHREAWALARRLGARYAQVDIACNLAWSLPVLELHDEAIALSAEALALGDYDGTPTLRNNLAWTLFDRGRLDEARPEYQALAQGRDPSLRCFARAKLVEIAARQHGARHAAVDAALAAAFDALAGTDLYSAHAAVVVVALDHGDDATAARALGWLRPQPLDAHLQQRLDAALARRGITAPLGA
jgi:DNA-binding SARP family transcriptional activator/tetratricopeptide (TPR) repeat protein